MSEFKSLFLNLCKENYVEPQESVLNRIQALFVTSNNVSQTVLDLSGETLTIGSCAVIGKALAHDLTFTSLILSDCMLNEEGAKSLLMGIQTNTVLRNLDLKGNNLQQKAAKALGTFLKNNHTLESLSLEWNSLGVWESAFSEFCEGLTTNAGLVHLDLRNNQLNTHCAQELSLALKLNKTLRSLDVRWNNIGLIGGRSIADSISENKTLCKCDIAGNNLPPDLMSAVEKGVSYNEDRLMLSASSRKQTQTMALEIDMLKDEKNKQMIDFIDQLDLAQSQLNQTYKSSSKKVTQLQGALEERKAALNALRAKLDMSEAALAMANQKLKDQSVLLDLERQENVEMSRRHEAVTRKEREDRKSSEQKYQDELRGTSDKFFSCQGELMEAERKCKTQHDEIMLLKESLAHIKAEHRLSVCNLEERLDAENRRHQNALHEQQKLHEQIQKALKVEASESEISWQERVNKLEQAKIELEHQLRMSQSQILEERNKFDEEQKRLRLELKHEERASIDQIQERLQMVQSEKASLQNQAAQLSAEITDAQAKKNAVSIELEGARRTIQSLQQQLSTKEGEMSTEVERVRNEMQRRNAQLEKECEQHASLRETIIRLEENLVKEASRNREMAEVKSHEIARLSAELQASERHVERMREDEARRGAALQAAVMNYVQGSPVRN